MENKIVKSLKISAIHISGYCKSSRINYTNRLLVAKCENCELKKKKSHNTRDLCSRRRVCHQNHENNNKNVSKIRKILVGSIHRNNASIHQGHFMQNQQQVQPKQNITHSMTYCVFYRKYSVNMLKQIAQ